MNTGKEWIENQNDYDQCPECHSNILINSLERGERVCTECGLIVNEKIIHKRGGMKDSCHHHEPLVSVGPKTKIDFRKKDAFGNRLDPKMIKKTEFLIKQQERKNEKEVKKNSGFFIAKMLFNKFPFFPDGSRKSLLKFINKYLNSYSVAGYTYKIFVCAIFYSICKRDKVPINLDDISNKMLVRKNKVYKFMKKRRDFIREISNGESVNIFELIEKICSDLLDSKVKIPENNKRLARNILKEIKEAKIEQGKNPNGMAGAALYVACLDYKNVKLTQKEIAKATGVAEATIRSSYKKIINFMSKGD